MKTTQEILTAAVLEKQQPVPSLAQRNEALMRMADCLLEDQEAILAANQQDLHAAVGSVSEVMLDRLLLNEERLAGMAAGLRALVPLPDPVHRILRDTQSEKGLHIQLEQVPFGVVAMIYESRPNVTSDAAGLIIKSGNVGVLRCGREAWQSASVIVRSLQRGLQQAGLHGQRIQLIEDRTRQSSLDLMKAKGSVDLLLPRGGAGLIQAVVQNAEVPVIETGTGICHIFVDDSADLQKAVQIVENAKCSRPSTCNAEEVLLVHQAIAPAFLPLLQKRLVEERRKAGQPPVELRLDEASQKIIPGTPATEEDFHTEFLDYILAVHVVADVEEAIAHIASHSTHHSEAILTQNSRHAELFLNQVDSAAVYVNASTRFTDGGEFGLGCELGISTQKMHARGPMGLDALCTTKWIIHGSGQIR